MSGPDLHCERLHASGLVIGHDASGWFAATDETTSAQRAHIDDLRTVVTRLLDLSARA